MLRSQNTSAFAQFLNRTNARAGRTEKIGFKNCASGTRQISRCDFFYETRNIDVRWTGVRAWRVVAIQTAIGFHQCFMRAKRREVL